MTLFKKILCVCILFSLMGCRNKKIDYPDFNVKFFYLDTCQHCQAFEENTIPLLEKEFEDAIHIEYYNMDDESSQELYQQITDELYFYDDEYLNDVPFFVMENEFALLGYSAGEEEELIKDIQRALNDESLGERLSGYRWEFEI